MRQKGYTLIELIFVVGIISALAGVLLVIINPLQKLREARDAGRKDTLRQLADGLNTYYLANSEYPNPCSATESSGGCASANGWGVAINMENAGEIREMPLDPTNNRFVSAWQTSGYSYFLISEDANGGKSGEYYIIGAFLENENDPYRLDNLSNRPFWPDCSTQIDFADNVFVLRNYRCPGDPSEY